MVFFDAFINPKKVVDVLNAFVWAVDVLDVLDGVALSRTSRKHRGRPGHMDLIFTPHLSRGVFGLWMWLTSWTACLSQDVQKASWTSWTSWTAF